MNKKNEKFSLRDFSFFTCTIFSAMGINATWQSIKKVVGCPFAERCSIDSVWMPVLVLMLTAAWYYYFQVCYWWLKRRPIERRVVIRAAFSGGAGVLLTFPYGLMFSFPAVLLAGYILASTEYKESDDPSL